jgi:hypothetical protein
MLNAIWTAATNGDLQAQAGVLRLEERRAKLLGLDAPKQIEDVREVSDAKATLLAKLKKMAERMRSAEIAAPLKDVTPLIEHEPSADAKTESVTKPVASVTKSPTAMTPVTKKRGRPAANGKAMTPAEKQRAFRERRKAKD